VVVKGVSLVEVVKPDKTKPARLLRKPETNELILEYTGVDGNVYRVPVAIAFLPQEFGDLAAQLGLADLFEKLRVAIVDSTIAVPTDLQYIYKDSLLLFSGTVTASGNTADIDVSRFTTLRIGLNVTAVSGTNPTLDVYVEGKYEAVDIYVPLLSKTGVTATGFYELGQVDNLAFRLIRVRWVVGGTSPSFTISVVAQAKV